MSKPIPEGQSLVLLEPQAQEKLFADTLSRQVNPETFAALETKARELDLIFGDRELFILAALDTPDRVQAFLNNQIYYNNDHISPDMEETAMPPRVVLKTGLAHCFEGAMFAYMVHYLHGHNPRLMLLEASQDSEHNLVVVQDPETGLYGCNAHSRYPHLDGRSAIYDTVRVMAESYAAHYYSDRTNDPNDVTLVGYSEPFDLVPRFGIHWMDSLEPLWDMYYTYIDDRIRFHYLFDESDRSHLYPVVQALKSKWIRIDREGKPFVSLEDLPRAARDLWHRFWPIYDPSIGVTRGQAREIELQFFDLTGTTPIDLQDNASDLVFFLESGYRIEQLFSDNT